MQDDRLYDEKELEKSWLISYSDLITLLFVIVIIIAALSSQTIKTKLDEVRKAEDVQKENLKEAIVSKDILDLKKLELQREVAILEARRDDLKLNLTSPKAANDKSNQNKSSIATGNEKSGPEQSNDKLATIRSQLASALQELNISFEETSEGLMVRFPEKVLFTSGSADLGKDGKKAITAVAKVLQRFSHKVRIEGFTDNVPIANSSYSSNWELSAARAIAVMKEMVNGHALPANRFMVAGWGENNPIADNSTPEQRSMNRRVEVLILADQP